MAFAISSLSDYSQKATELLRSGVLYNTDFSEFDLQTGISYKEYLNFIDVDSTLVAGSCGADDENTTTLTEKEITVIPMKSDNKFCFDDLYKKALKEINVGEAITKDFIGKLKSNVEKIIWQGDTIGNTGWLAEAVSDSDVITVEGSTLTTTNIDGYINDMIGLIPDALFARGILTLYVSYNVYNIYKQSISTSVFYSDQKADLGINEMFIIKYENQIKIKAVAGLTGKNDNMFLTWSKNLVIGTDDVNTLTSAKWVIDEVTEYAWLKAKFKLGSTYKYGNEIVLFKKQA